MAESTIIGHKTVHALTFLGSHIIKLLSSYKHLSFYDGKHKVDDVVKGIIKMIFLLQKYDNKNANKTTLDAQGYLQEHQMLTEDDYSFKSCMSNQQLHQKFDEDAFRIQLNGKIMQSFLDCI